MKRNHSLYILTLILFTACAAPKELVLPQAMHTPAVNGNVNDSLSLAGLREVFKDPPLQNLLDTAMQQNFDLLAATQRVEMAKATLAQAKHAMLPRLDVSVTAGADRYGDYTMNGVGNFDTNLSPNIDKNQRIPTPVTPDYFAGLRSSWEIDLWGKLKSRKKASYARFLASEEGRKLLRTQVVASITGIYYELLALDSELEIIRRNITLQEAAVATVHIQKDGGRATALAVQQFTAQLLSTRALEFNARQSIASLEYELNALLGRLPQPVTRGRFKDDEMPTVTKLGVPARLLLQRPDIRQAELEMTASKLDVHAARQAFFPSLTITPYAGFNAFNASLLFQSPASLAWGILGGITAPVFSQRQLKSNHQFNTAGARTAFYRYQQAVVNSYKEVGIALNEVENQQQTYDLKLKEVEVLKQAVSTANTLFTTGYASYLEVITAQKSVLESELALVNTRRNVYHGLVSLYRALGGS